jgi:MSHA biogenesis protein MshQ
MLQTACGPGGFTYIGQTFDYLVTPVLTVTAKNAAGTTTVNYTGGFFKLITDDLQNRTYSSTAGMLDASGVPPDTDDPVVVPLPFPSGAGTATFSSGSGLLFTRAAAEAPFDAQIQLSIDVFDSDGVAPLGSPRVSFGAAGGILFSSGNEARYGRVRFVNAYGSENVDLPVPLIVEYYAGSATGFVANGDDTCTAGISVAFDVYTENLADGETCARDSGAPGSSGIGCATAAPLPEQFRQPPVGGDFNLTLAAPGADNTGSVSMIATAPDYLMFDWDAAAPGDEQPSGLATFGLYGGESRQIYIRETFN